MVKVTRSREKQQQPRKRVENWISFAGALIAKLLNVFSHRLPQPLKSLANWFKCTLQYDESLIAFWSIVALSTLITFGRFAADTIDFNEHLKQLQSHRKNFARTKWAHNRCRNEGSTTRLNRNLAWVLHCTYTERASSAYSSRNDILIKRIAKMLLMIMHFMFFIVSVFFSSIFQSFHFVAFAVGTKLVSLKMEILSE